MRQSVKAVTAKRLLVLAISLMVSSVSYAGQKNAEMEVSLTILSSCKTITNNKVDKIKQEVNIKVLSQCTQRSNNYIVVTKDNMKQLHEYNDNFSHKDIKSNMVLADTSEGLEKTVVAKLSNNSNDNKFLFTINY